MSLLTAEDIISIVIIVCSAVLCYGRVITPDQFIQIISIILSFQSGRLYQMYMIQRKVAKNPKSAFDLPKNYQKMLDRFGVVCLISGVTLILEKFIVSGHTITYPPIWDHALWGLILLSIGFGILCEVDHRTKKKNK